MVCEATFDDVPLTCSACGGRVRVQGASEAAVRSELDLPDEARLTRALLQELGVPVMRLDEFEIDPEAAATISRDMAESFNVIPVHRMGRTLILAMSDPSNLIAYEAVRTLTGHEVDVVYATGEDIRAAIARAYPPDT